MIKDKVAVINTRFNNGICPTFLINTKLFTSHSFVRSEEVSLINCSAAERGMVMGVFYHLITQARKRVEI